MKRRTILGLPVTLAGAAYYSRAAGAVPSTRTAIPVSQIIAAAICQTRYEALSPALVETTKYSLLDAIGVSIAAAGLEPLCTPFRDQALFEGGLEQSAIWGTKRKAPAAQAALANGALAHALDYEDVHDASGMHPNAACVPALLAVAQAEGGISGKEFIAALAAGCDLACRLGLARKENLNKYGWYFPPIASAFGATAAVGRLLKLTENQMLDAISMTLCQTSCSSEILFSPESHIRAIRDAFPAQTAVRSGYFAKKGVRGFEHPFEGKSAFITMYARGEYNIDILLDDIGTRYLGEDISFKAWPACRGSHPYIQACLDLMETTPINSAQIERVDVKVGLLDQALCEPVESKRAPSTAIDAKFSIPFTVASALLRRNVTLSSFQPDALEAPDVLSLARKVNHEVDQNAPRTPHGKLLRVVLKDGRTIAPNRKPLLGSPERPMSKTELEDKFIDCMAYAPERRSPAQIRSLVNMINSIEHLDDLRALTI